MLGDSIPSAATQKRGSRVVDAVPALFDTALLRDEAAVEVAIRAFERYLVDPATNLEGTVTELESSGHSLEFILSAVNDETHRLLVIGILQRFPGNPEEFSTSLAYRLLSRFPLFYLFLPDIRATDLPESVIRSYRICTETALGVLKALAKHRFDTFEDSTVDDVDDPDFQFALSKRKKQHKRKQSKRGRIPASELKAFATYGAQVPTNVEEATQMSASILDAQMHMLKEYLDWFRLPLLLIQIKELYLPRSVEIVQTSTMVTVSSGQSPLIEDETEAPAAYPLVQPMKAALYFDSADGFGEWRILVSTRADRDLRQARKRDGKTFAIFVKKIKELSRGHFSEDNQKRLTGLDVEVPIYEAKMTGDTRLVYQVDCIPEFESDVERQVLRIFGIYTHAQLDRRFWDCMSRQLGRRGIEYKKRCTFRNAAVNPGDNVIMPASWPPPAQPVLLEPVNGVYDMRKEDLEELHSLLVLEKFITFSQAFLNSILVDQDVAHVFDVTPQEKKIIEHSSSCYVLGRSGTGKTTTMLFKMLGIERAWESRRDTMPRPRQLFVTQSRVLAEKVEEYFAKLLESLGTACQSPTELITMAARKRQQQEQGLVDRDEEIYWRGDLPKRYGALQDEHFPMFLTYDHICRLLESEFNHTDSEAQKKEAVALVMHQLLEQDPESRDGALSNDYMQQRRAAFVSYGTFLEEYWSRFPQSLTKGLDPTLVFGEFMGVIKGSELSLARPEGYIDKDTYYNLSHRTQGTFTNQREGVYKLFQAYLKKKKERGDYDAADRTHALIRSLRSMGVPGQEIDFIYVDEAQDNLLIDALVLRTLCRNPHGLFWAGDTAQTISVGSAFRFNDLKSFLYRYEEANTGVSAEWRAQPESFHLAVNYRSHAGIVNSAHSVIELITKFWPHAIDALAEEKGMIDGLKPVFFSGWDQNTVRYEQFLFGESGRHIEFGAEQCILVRDDVAREKLRAQVGDIGLIMTLYESKGLEFNDVLLYNFFEDSTVDLSQWRVVLNALPREQRGNHPAPRFDDVRHSGVCRELKFLYVAITRARKNLWIADCSEKGEPMRILWTDKDQIQNCTPGTDVPQLAMSSTAEDWAKTALSLFNNRRYMQAMHCYDRAGLNREKAVAHAYYLRELARTTSVIRGNATAQALAFTVAAQAFIASAQSAITEKKAYYRIAGECYVQSGDDYRAARAYFDAAEYTLATQHFRKAGKFEEAVEVVKVHKDKITPSVAESIVDVSRLYFLREKQIKKARELFDTDEEALEYMDDFGLDVARASYLEDIGRYVDAAELHLAEGNTLEAVRLLTLDRANKTSVERAFRCLLDGLWLHLSCGVPVTEELLRANGTVAKLLRLTRGLEGIDIDERLRDEVLMFRAIAKRDLQGILVLADKFISRRDVLSSFLSLDAAFSYPLKLQTESLPEIAVKLHTFLDYARELQKLTAIPNPCDSSGVRKVFAIQALTEDSFLLHKNTLLASKCCERLTPTAHTSEQGTTVSRWELDALIRSVLRDRLRHRVNEENKMCRNLRPMQPCLPYASSRQCNRGECPCVHIDTQQYDAAFYNARVQLHILQILIYQTLFASEDPNELAKQRSYWLQQLYDALFPPYYKLGSLYLLSPALIPELEQGLQVVKAWVRELFDKLDPHRPAVAFLSRLIRLARLALTFDMKAAQEYLHRAHSVKSYRHSSLLRGPDKAYVVHDLLAHMQNNSDDVTAFSRGVLFLDHVLQTRSPIDIGLLCDFMDHMCGSMIIADRLQTRGTLHNVTLPKSWLTRLVPDVEALRSRDMRLSIVYKKRMADLLEQVYSGVDAGYLLFETRDLSTLGFPIKNIFFGRICMNLCLWGYNSIAHPWPLRGDITRAITSVKRPGRTFNPLIEAYVNAKTWEHLARTVRHAVKDSTLDEMVQLHHGSYPMPKTTLPDVRRVVYNHIEDIPWLLKIGGSTATSLRAEALPFVPASLATSQVEDSVAEADDSEATAGLDGEEEVGIEQDVDLDNITRAIDAEQSIAETAAPTAEEIAASTVIARAYTHYVARTRVSKSKKNTMQEMRRRIFAAFRTQAQTMEWPYSYYRMLFLGPIPHLYVAIESTKNYLFAARNSVKKRLDIAKHLDLEVVQSSLTQMNRLFRDSVKLHATLAPAADIHQTRDLEALKACTIEVEVLMRSLPSTAVLESEQDLKIALRAIVELKKAPVKQPRPELNIDDLDLHDG